MSKSEPLSRSVQREQTREQILLAAISLFARTGFEATSLADIGREAGTKKTLVQYHFPTKEKLWKDAATHLWNERNERIAQALSDTEGDLKKQMRRSLTVLAQYTSEKPQWLWFMFHEAAADSPRRQWLIDNFLHNDYQLGTGFVEQFQKKGVIRAGPPLHLLHLISGALTYNMLVAPQTQQATGVDLSSTESIAAQVDLIQSLLSPDSA